MFDRAVIEKLDSPAMAINGWKYIIYVPNRSDIDEDYASTMREAREIKQDIDTAISRGEYNPHRMNPSLVILSNPSTFASERALREVWEEFHLRSGDKAKVIEIPDIEGVPRGVMVLGSFEGMEVQRHRNDDEFETVTIKRSDTRGPWVATDASKKRLWIVAADSSDLSRFKRFNRWVCRSIYYYPNARSGKHHPSQGFRHEFGETGEGGRPRSRWHLYYPGIEILGPRAIRLSRPKNGFRIEDRGIVG